MAKKYYNIAKKILQHYQSMKIWEIFGIFYNNLNCRLKLKENKLLYTLIFSLDNHKFKL